MFPLAYPMMIGVARSDWTVADLRQSATPYGPVPTLHDMRASMVATAGGSAAPDTVSAAGDAVADGDGDAVVESEYGTITPVDAPAEDATDNADAENPYEIIKPMEEREE